MKKKKHEDAWSRPPNGWTKLNVDGAWVKEDRQGGTGLILTDEGYIIFAASRNLQSCDSPLEAELLSCSEGIALRSNIQISLSSWNVIALQRRR
jgi:hypothetical protein